MSKFWILRTLRRIKFLKNRRIDLELEVNGKKFTVPLIAEIGFHNYKMKEFWMLDLFKMIQPSETDILLDVGANTGQTLLKWKSVNVNAPYYGLEPIPQCVEYLNELATSNKFNNTHIIQKALFNEDGPKELFYHFEDETDRTASLVKTHYKEKKSETVECILFEQFLEEYSVSKQDIKVVKIDVEGGELEVLQNLLSFLKSDKPIVILEVRTYSPKVNTQRLNALQNLLNDLPHQLYHIKKKGMNFNGLDKIDKIEVPTPKGLSDYILIPPGIQL